MLKRWYYICFFYETAKIILELINGKDMKTTHLEAYISVFFVTFSCIF